MRRGWAILVLVTVGAGCGSSAARSAGTPPSAREADAGATATSTMPTTRVGESGATGATGGTGETGATGATGETGPPGLSGFEMVRDAVTITTDLDHGRVLEHSVSCPAGKTVIGGGAYVTVVPAGDANAFEYLQRSEPSSATTWTAVAAWDHYNGSRPQQLRLSVTATCAFVG